MLAATTTSSDGNPILGLFFLILIIAAYWAPTIIAAIKQHNQLGSIAAFNCFLGWTFVGWVAALVWGLSNPKTVKVKMI